MNGTAFVDSIERIGEDGRTCGTVEVPNRFRETPGTHPTKAANTAVNIKIVNPRLGALWPSPRYETAGAAALDVRVCIDEQVTLAPGENAVISAGFAMDIEAHELAAVLLPHPGRAAEHGLVLANLVGAIGSDDHEVVKVAAWNRGSQEITIEPGRADRAPRVGTDRTGGARDERCVHARRVKRRKEGRTMMQDRESAGAVFRVRIRVSADEDVVSERRARARIIDCTIDGGRTVEENGEHADARHEIDPWRIVVAAAPLVAVAALAGGVNVEARAEHESAIEVLRAASWVAAAFAFAWFCIVAMMGGGPSTKVLFELRMLIERNSRMPYAANAHSALSAAVTLAVVLAMLR